MNPATATLLVAVAALSAGTVALVVAGWAFGAGAQGCARLGRWQSLALLTAPLGAALIAAFALLAPSFRGWFGAADHCAGHVHHAHVCLAHPAAWGEVPMVATGLAVVVAVTLAVGLLRLLAGTYRSISLTRRLDRLSESNPVGYRVVRDSAVTAFSGWGRIFVTSAALDALSPPELAALLAHEHTHRRRGDPFRVLLVELAAAFHVPFARRMLMRAYLGTVERECDDVAAEHHGAVHVASALLKCVRGNVRGVASTGAPLLAGVESADLGQRIRRLLDAGHRSTRRGSLGRLRLLTLMAMLLLAVWLALPAADPAHHLFESLLGLIH